MSQLRELAKPFPSKLISPPAPGKHGDFINHAVVNQRLLQIIGAFSFKIVREIWDGDIITGVVCELAVKVDDRIVTIQEVGDNDNETKRGSDEYVEKTNGARLKKASSDGFKRCAMRLGVGLELWSKDQYFLYERLTDLETPGSEPLQGDAGGDELPHSSEVPATSRQEGEDTAREDGVDSVTGEGSRVPS